MTENRPGLSLFQRCGWQTLASFLVVALSLVASAARADGTMALKFTATRAAPVCTLTSSASQVSVPDELASAYQSSKDGNSGGNYFTLSVSNCNSTGLGQAKTKIAVYGDRDGTSGDYGFRSSTGTTSTNIGFFFRYNTKVGSTGKAVGGDSAFAMQTLATAYKVTFSDAGVSPQNKSMDFWVGLTTDGYTSQGPATPGSLTARMHFDLVFE